MKKLNIDIIKSNIQEAREQLQEIETSLLQKRSFNEGYLQVSIEHAYHHLNTAWNARFIPQKRYKQSTNNDYNTWGKYPQDIEVLKI